MEQLSTLGVLLTLVRDMTQRTEWATLSCTAMVADGVAATRSYAAQVRAKAIRQGYLEVRAHQDDPAGPLLAGGRNATKVMRLRLTPKGREALGALDKET